MDREYDEVSEVVTLDVLNRLAERLRAPPAPPVIITETPFGGQSIIAMWFDEMLDSPRWTYQPTWAGMDWADGPDETYVMVLHDDLLRDLFYRAPPRRSASARKRKAARYWRK